MSWDEAEEELLRADPRFEAGVALRASQDYEEVTGESIPDYPLPRLS